MVSWLNKRNIKQWVSKDMLFHKIQKLVLEFDKKANMIILKNINLNINKNKKNEKYKSI